MNAPTIRYPQPHYPQTEANDSSTSLNSSIGGGFQFSAGPSPNTIMTSPPRSLRSLGSPLATKFENIHLTDSEHPSPSPTASGPSFAGQQQPPSTTTKPAYLLPYNHQSQGSNESGSALNTATASASLPQDAKPSSSSSSKVPRKRSAKGKKDEGLPNGFPIEYFRGPGTTPNGKFIEEGKYECTCSKVLSVESWRKNGRTHEKSEYHTDKLGLPAYEAANTVCPGCGKNFHRSDALRRHLESPSDNNTCAAAKIKMPANKPKPKPGATSDAKLKAGNARVMAPPPRTPLQNGGLSLEGPSQDVKDRNLLLPGPPVDPRSPAPPAARPMPYQGWLATQGSSPFPSGGHTHRSSVIVTDSNNTLTGGLGLVIPSSSPPLVHRYQPSLSPISPRERYSTRTPLLGSTASLSPVAHSPRPPLHHVKGESYSPSIHSTRSYASNLPPCTPSIGAQAALLAEPPSSQYPQSSQYPNQEPYQGQPQHSFYMTGMAGSSSQVSSHSNGASLPPLEDDGEDGDEMPHLTLSLTGFDQPAHTPSTTQDSAPVNEPAYPQYPANSYYEPTAPGYDCNAAATDYNHYSTGRGQESYPPPPAPPSMPAPPASHDGTTYPHTFHPTVYSPQLFMEQLASASLNHAPLPDPNVPANPAVATMHPVEQPPPQDLDMLWPFEMTSLELMGLGSSSDQPHVFDSESLQRSQQEVYSMYAS